MCGVFGRVAPLGAPPCSFTTEAAKLLRHRGPDQFGTYHVRLNWASVSLASSRLKIVDQSDIDVPFRDLRYGVSVAFNGEIYNHLSLKAELSDGNDWKTSSDVEVLPRAWRRWGAHMLDHMNGLWSMILVDHLQHQVFAARDRAGKKPLYYAYSNDVLYLTSEAKALPIALVEKPCLDLETLEFDCLEDTPLLGVHRLLPGSYIHMNRATDISPIPPKKAWWHFPVDTSTSKVYTDRQVGGVGNREGVDVKLAESLTEELRELIIGSIKLRLSNEVPVAVQLSGGLDSAIIQAVCKSEALYCVGFPADGIDTLGMAKVAAGAGREALVKQVTFDRELLMRHFPEIVGALDTAATWSGAALWFLNRQIAADGGRIVLSGEGADELFGGYARYRVLWHLEQMRLDTHLEGYNPLMEYMVGSATDLMAKMLDRSEGGRRRAHAAYLVEQFRGPASLRLPDAMARVDWHVTLPILLRMGDRCAMAHSLENRCPFLDYRIIELAARVPHWMKINARESKHILRDVARSLGVDPQIVDEQTKLGLVVPWGKWNNVAGSRGVYSRESFFRLTMEAWRAQVLRPALCARESCSSIPITDLGPNL